MKVEKVDEDDISLSSHQIVLTLRRDVGVRSQYCDSDYDQDFLTWFSIAYANFLRFLISFQEKTTNLCLDNTSTPSWYLNHKRLQKS